MAESIKLMQHHIPIVRALRDDMLTTKYAIWKYRKLYGPEMLELNRNLVKSWDIDAEVEVVPDYLYLGSYRINTDTICSNCGYQEMCSSFPIDTHIAMFKKAPYMPIVSLLAKGVGITVLIGLSSISLMNNVFSGKNDKKELLNFGELKKYSSKVEPGTYTLGDLVK